jgi:cytochrome P450
MVHLLLGNMQQVMKFNDGKAHTSPRGAMARPMAPSNVNDTSGPNNLTNQIRNGLEELFAPARNRGRSELIRDVARPLPAMVIMDMIGIPKNPSTRKKLERLSHLTTVPFTNDTQRTGALVKAAPSMLRGVQSSLQMIEYFDQFARQQEKLPLEQRTPLVNALFDAESRGKMSRETTVANLGFLLVAGHETTTNLMANGTLALLRDRDQQDLLFAALDNPNRFKNGVAELMRYVVPVQMVLRTAVDDRKIEGTHTTIPAGEKVRVVLGAANRDPKVFGSDAGKLDVTRFDGPGGGEMSKQILTFAAGAHVCLGMRVAELELMEYFNAFLLLADPHLGPQRVVDDSISLSFLGAREVPLLCTPTPDMHFGGADFAPAFGR